MLIKTYDYCKTQNDLDFIIRKVSEVSEEFGLKLKSGVKLEDIPEYSYLSVLNNEIVGILQADVFNNDIYEVEVFRFRESSTFSLDVMRFYKLLSRLNPNRLKFTIKKHNKYAEKIALKIIKKYFKYFEMKYFIPYEDNNIYMYVNGEVDGYK